MVVGSHTHCLQGAAYFGEQPVFYSLGNFVFGQTIDRSAILKVTVTPEGAQRYQYLPIYAEGGVTKLATGQKAQEILGYLQQISAGAVIAADERSQTKISLEKCAKKFTDTRSKPIIKKIISIAEKENEYELYGAL